MDELTIYYDSHTNQYFLLEVFKGKPTLKIKREGWSDTWSLPLEEVKGPK